MKILVIDDHPLILEALQHLLRQLDSGVELYDACSAEAGRLLIATHPDAGLLLLDLNLPGVQGMELLAELRQRFPAVPVVVISGSDRHEDIARAIDRGGHGFYSQALQQFGDAASIEAGVIRRRLPTDGNADAAQDWRIAVRAAFCIACRRQCPRTGPH